jgi:hypothetical protein
LGGRGGEVLADIGDCDRERRVCWLLCVVVGRKVEEDDSGLTRKRQVGDALGENE